MFSFWEVKYLRLLISRACRVLGVVWIKRGIIFFRFGRNEYFFILDGFHHLFVYHNRIKILIIINIGLIYSLNPSWAKLMNIELIYLPTFSYLLLIITIYYFSYEKINFYPTLKN